MGPKSQKTPIYRQIVSPAGPQEGSKMELENDSKNDGQKYVQNRIRSEEHHITFQQGGH
jgi:hypothetical protein